MNHTNELLNYYKKKLPGNRTSFAQRMDRFFYGLSLFLLGFFLFSLSYLWNLTMMGQSLLVPILSVLITILAMTGVVLKRQIGMDLTIKKSKEDYEKKVFANYISSLNSRDFTAVIKAVMEYALSFHELSVKDMKIYGEDKQVPFVAKCVQTHPDTELDIDDLYAFYNEMKDEGFCQGYFITPSSFNQEGREYTHRLSPFHIEIIDGHKLILYIKDLGLLPLEEEMIESMLKELKEQEKRMKKQGEQVMPGKIRQYILLGTILLMIYFITGFHTLYFILSYFCFGLSFFLFIRNKLAEETPSSDQI